MQVTSQGLHVVYCWLRSKTTTRAKAGSPYYIGIASNASRPYQKHEWKDHKGRTRKVVLPKDEALIRVIDVVETREEAQEREQFFIARYGRRFKDPGGILHNSGLGGESGSYGNQVEAERIAEWDSVKVSAAWAGVTPEAWVLIPLVQKAAYRGHRRRFPDAQITVDVFLAEIYENREDSRQRQGWKEVGAPEEEWKLLTNSQRKVALDRHDNGLPWNVDRRADQPREVVERRHQNSTAARLSRGAMELGMPLEVYEGLSRATRYDIKKWLKANPGKTWEQRPKQGEQIPSGAENKRMQAGAEKYGVELSLWASWPDRQRRNFRKRFNNGIRGEALWKGLPTDPT